MHRVGPRSPGAGAVREPDAPAIFASGRTPPAHNAEKVWTRFARAAPTGRAVGRTGPRALAEPLELAEQRLALRSASRASKKT